jgi:hypothetical protein
MEILAGDARERIARSVWEREQRESRKMRRTTVTS